jgi:hypothetical protein
MGSIDADPDLPPSAGAHPRPGQQVAGVPQGEQMPKPNYGFEKRQRELEKKRKKEEKAARKAAPQPATTPEPVQPPQDVASS